MNKTLGQIYLKELEDEYVVSRKCLERIPEALFEYKPHEKSMKMLSLAVMIADIPRWVTFAIQKGEINFATYPQLKITTTADLVINFDKNMEEARAVLAKASDEDMAKPFVLKSGEQVLWTTTAEQCISSTINHSVHHRGQMTVYMRLNNIPVPSLYGPSADEQTF